MGAKPAVPNLSVAGRCHFDRQRHTVNPRRQTYARADQVRQQRASCFDGGFALPNRAAADVMYGDNCRWDQLHILAQHPAKQGRLHHPISL